MSKQALLSFLGSTTAKLAASYLSIIMVLSLTFSFVFYNTSTHELGRQLPPSSIFNTPNGGNFDPGADYHHFFRDRIDEGRRILLGRLVMLNVLALGGGAFLSYQLARRTLQPIENAMEAQSRFVTDASHELRTPLTAILASNEVALRKPSLSSAAAKDVIRSNMEEMTKLKELSEGLLSMAQQNGQALARQPVSLQDIAGEAMNRILQAAQAKHISIEDSVPNVSIMGDRRSLVQAVVILLDNAVKYSLPKSTIYIEGRSAEKYGYLSVRDTGVGISPVDLPHIFDRFYRADVSRTKTASSGYGIGLSIAKKIVEQHQGKIMASSNLDHGSTFVIELPLA